jgi:hypothetical protein
MMRVIALAASLVSARIRLMPTSTSIPYIVCYTLTLQQTLHFQTAGGTRGWCAVPPNYQGQYLVLAVLQLCSREQASVPLSPMPMLVCCTQCLHLCMTQARVVGARHQFLASPRLLKTVAV